jgi:hypothetical protein
MSRRIDIELTSSLNDGSWTWRAAGARQPKGVLDGSILPGGSKVGDELKVEIEQEIDGITVLGVVAGRDKHDPDLIELLPVEREFQPVIETRAKRERGERPRKSEGDRRPRRDDDRGKSGGRDDRGKTGGRNDRSGGAERTERPRTGERPARDRDRARQGGSEGGRRERRGPSFTPPPEIPQRPKPKRLRPGKTYRSAVLAELPPEQRPIAEVALLGMGAVRSRLKEENERATAEGRATMPESSVVKIAEELLPTLRVAEWRDRAEAAKAQASELDLRDLRSVVAASGDPIVARDESTRTLADELKQLLANKQEQELQFWYGDIDAALAVGRVIRALRLSSQPPKAGVPFPSDIAQRLADSANASLAPMDAPDRWSAMLEAAAFSPVRSMIKPARKPDVVNDELTATVTRLAPALPQVAALFEIEVPAKATMPKPLRPAPRPTKGKQAESERPKRGERPPRPPKATPSADKPALEQAESDQPSDAAAAPVESAASESADDTAAAPDEKTSVAPAESSTEQPDVAGVDESSNVDELLVPDDGE